MLSLFIESSNRIHFAGSYEQRYMLLAGKPNFEQVNCLAIWHCKSGQSPASLEECPWVDTVAMS
jgi:hypothetical protein